MKIDHELIHKSVVDSGGFIVGGYMRSWVAAGEPSDTGWDDIDVYGISLEKAKYVSDKIKEATNGKKTDFKFTGIVMDFYCNSWIYDGKSIYREKTNNGKTDDQAVLEQTQQKMAVMLSMQDFTINVPLWKTLKYIQKYNFTIHNPDESFLDLKLFFDIFPLFFYKIKFTRNFVSDAERKMATFSFGDLL